nr:capsid protein [Bacillus thuringiensis]
MDGVTKLRVGSGITSVDPDSNEETDESFYYDGEGAAQRDVLGVMLLWGFSGHRDYNDLAQNYIMGLRIKTGLDRKTNFTITYPNGDKLEGVATISEIKDAGGDANRKGEIEFTISYDGLPTFTPAPVTP